jgi:hypothetical protein
VAVALPVERFFIHGFFVSKRASAVNELLPAGGLPEDVAAGTVPIGRPWNMQRRPDRLCSREAVKFNDQNHRIVASVLEFRKRPARNSGDLMLAAVSRTRFRIVKYVNWNQTR